MPPTEVGNDRKLTKNEKRRLKDKQRVNGKTEGQKPEGRNLGAAEALLGVQIEYVSAPLDFLERDAKAQVLDELAVEEFKAMFQKITRPEVLMSSEADNDPQNSETSLINSASSSSVDAGTSKATTGAPESSLEEKLSRKKKKEQSRLTVAELKQLVQRPDVVEAHDVASNDPVLLIHLKAYRNTVPIPRHWSHKSKYLQRKRGIEKPPFQLPEFIADTGIAKIRDSLLEAEEKAKAKSRARARVQPKMGKIDIDYQVLHDAFFKYQTKPKLTAHGDLYFEGKEFENHGRNFRPGVLSRTLREALGLPPPDATGPPLPPPWLVNMQRYGPPPSYATQRIPGLNAPLPRGAQFGYQPGGWGKPPVDEYGRPLYGDVFGALPQAGAGGIDEGEEIEDRCTRWGEVVAGDDDAAGGLDDDDEDEDDDQNQHNDQGTDNLGGDDQVDASGRSNMATAAAAAAAAGLAKIQAASIDDCTVVDLRKRDDNEAHSASAGPSAPPPELYRVLSERAPPGGAGAGEAALFGSAKTYVIAAGGADGEAGAEGVSAGAGGAGGTSTVTTSAGGEKSKRKRAGEAEAAAKKFKDNFKF